ncbi:GerAB/ArcD/ProY family transporter [Tepidibacter formicigenes]|jgi:spore germination protein|uniref:Spore germination protein n=1 Tax=Tepidibacter formicigenes DSM 15518 TaxID=1123349 RepID=A0A1M6SVR0_9FIRM|nr:endospore germination permease [Tepidibacter formicigenes]SHK48757.1 spore germination protein [Tepidibacter formicigenes DSM 15518]
MISSKEKITTSQAITLLISSILGVGILSLPRNLVDEVSGAVFIVLIISTMICIILGYFIYKVIYYFPNKTIMQIGEELLTKPGAYLIGFVFFIYYVYSMGMVTRIFVEVIKMYMLKKTPSEVIIILMLIVCAYGARKGIEGIARLSQILLILMGIPVIVIFFFSLQTADFTNLMPISNASIPKILPSIFNTVFAFSGFEAMLIIGFFLRKPKDAFKIQYITLIFIGLIYIFFVVITVAVFGQVETSHLMWPTLTLVKVIDIPGAFLENLDALVMGAWTLNIFMTICVFLYNASLIIADILNCKEAGYFNFPIIPIVYVISLCPQNLAHVYDILNSKFSLVIQIIAMAVIPTILFIIAISNKKVKKI